MTALLIKRILACGTYELPGVGPVTCYQAATDWLPLTFYVSPDELTVYAGKRFRLVTNEVNTTLVLDAFSRVLERRLVNLVLT